MRTWVSLWGPLLLLLGTADGYLNGIIQRCEFNSSQSADIRFVSSYVFNKLEYMRFRSDEGDEGFFRGFTAFGVQLAAKLNLNPDVLQNMRNMKENYCAPSVRIMYSSTLSKSVSPYAVLHAAPSGGSEKVLVCSVYGFFPKDISVTWTNHQQLVTTGVTTTDLLPDSNWYYQLHSSLEYSPRSGDQISCVIEHISLKEPMVLDYGGGLSDVDLKMVLIGAAGLALGLILSLTGFFCYKFNNQDQN